MFAFSEQLSQPERILESQIKIFIDKVIEWKESLICQIRWDHIIEDLKRAWNRKQKSTKTCLSQK